MPLSLRKKRLEKQNYDSIKMEKTPDTLQDKATGAQNFCAFFGLGENIFFYRKDKPARVYLFYGKYLIVSVCSYFLYFFLAPSAVLATIR